MTFTVVGHTTVSAGLPTTVPQDFTIPVHASTVVGDLLVLGYWPAVATEITDPRFSTVSRSGLAAPMSSGAWGVATDLTDVTFRQHSYSYPALMICLTLRGTGYENAGAHVQPTLDAAVTGGYAPTGDAVVVVGDSSTGSGTLDPPGDDAGWSTQATISAPLWVSGNLALKMFIRSGAAPVPSLTSAFDIPDDVTRAVFELYLQPPPAPRGHLRQRQSPRRTPSRVRRPNLRQRQYPR